MTNSPDIDVVRAQVAELRQTMESLARMAEQGLPVADAEAQAQQRLTQAEQRLATLEMRVGRDVHGDVVGGSKATTFDLREQCGVGTQVNVGRYVDQRTIQHVKPGTAPDVLREAYLRRVMARTRGLPLAGVDPKVAGEEGDGDLQLSAVYTALLTQRSVRRGEHEREGLVVESEVRRLSVVEVFNQEPRLVLLGAPGSGKTTFINFVALCMAGEILDDSEVNIATLTMPLPDERPMWQWRDDDALFIQPWDHGALLPVRVVLRDFVARGLPDAGQDVPVDGSTLWRFISNELGAHQEYVPYLKAMLLEGRGLILLDGLDEVPEADHRRQQVKAAVQGFVEDFPRCRYLVTSRTYAYQRQDWKLKDFAETVLAPFTPGQIMYFVDRWYSHVGTLRGMVPDDAQGQAVLLKSAIEHNARLAELAARPLLLTLMASLHAWRGGSLPEKREELYADAVDLLLEQWEGRKIVRNAAGEPVVWQRSLAEWFKVDRLIVRRELERLAFEAHRDQPELKGTADVSQARLVDALMRAVPDQAINPVQLAAFLRDRAGLLAARGERVYTFPHRTFQEYLAACYLTDHGFPYTLVDLLRSDPQRWREAVLLAGAKAARGSAFAAWALVEALCHREPCATVPVGHHWGALLASQVLLENEAQLTSVPELHAPKMKRVRRWMHAIVDHGWLPPVDRALAGDALAALGDLRDLDAGVEVPEGPFLMGDDEDEDAKPQHEVWLPAYRIAKCPVTVGQFRTFVERSGYRPSDPDCLRGVVNHPVIWVTWHDARAYCAWLTGLWRAEGRIATDEVVRLPTEAEWEKAASWEYPSLTPPPGGIEGGSEYGIEGGNGKGSGCGIGRGHKRRFPWGDEWDAAKCNVEATGVSSTTPVGIFPEGASPYGCLDMAGNVWEWTISLWGTGLSEPDFKYPYDPDDGREDVKASDNVYRVVRGGSYYNDANSVRCASRRRLDLISDLYDFVGFRWVIASL